jgi:hypothetical protein
MRSAQTRIQEPVWLFIANYLNLTTLCEEIITNANGINVERWNPYGKCVPGWAIGLPASPPALAAETVAKFQDILCEICGE